MRIHRFKKIIPLIAILLVGTLVSGCATQHHHAAPKQTMGTMVGAGLGALAGSQIGSGDGKLVAVAMGTLAGAMIGNSVGQSLDRADRAAAYRAQQQAHAAPVGKTIIWNNPNSGNSGAVTATRDGFDRRSGTYCREYQTTIWVDGEEQAAYGTSCRQPDGSWEIVQ